VIVSLAGCTKPNDAPPVTQPTPSAGEGPKASACFGVKAGVGIPADHIPPMGIDGGNGSIIIETHNKLLKRPGAAFEYEDVPESADDRYGELEQVRVITEMVKPPYIIDVRYGEPLPDGCQLQLWYQRISPTAPTPHPTPPQQPDCLYDESDIFNRPADVVIKGGRGAQFFRMTFPGQLNPQDNSFKCARPNRYKHADPASGRNHFRVGKWRIVDAGGNIPVDPTLGKFEDSVKDTTRLPEHFRFYVFFKDFQPGP
jgi:hypothetical protein